MMSNTVLFYIETRVGHPVRSRHCTNSKTGGFRQEVDKMYRIIHQVHLFRRAHIVNQLPGALAGSTCILSSLRVWLAETMRAFSPRSFLCRVLLRILPERPMIMAPVLSVAALPSLILARFAPSSLCWKGAATGQGSGGVAGRWYGFDEPRVRRCRLGRGYLAEVTLSLSVGLGKLLLLLLWLRL